MITNVSILYAVSATILDLITLKDIGLHLTLQLLVAQSTEDSQGDETEAKDKHETEEGPFELVCEDEGPKDIVYLVLSPSRLALDVREGEEVAMLRDRNCSVLEEVATEQLHVVEDTLKRREAHTRQWLDSKERFIGIFIGHDLISVSVYDESLGVRCSLTELQIVAFCHEAIGVQRGCHI
jgi:hypothetical protein